MGCPPLSPTRTCPAIGAPSAPPELTSREGGSAAWVGWFAEDGRMVQPGVGLIQGHSAIAERMVGLDAPGVSLVWEPDYADIAQSGELGWTTGTFVSEGPAPDGGVARTQGRYVSIWRRQPDGSWRVVMDLGNPTEPAPAG